MAKLVAKESWLIFIDTNIFLDFYRIGGESADRQLRALDRHRDSIITGDQIRMEFLKNRQKVIVDSISKLNKPSKLSVPPIVTDYQPVKMLGKNLSEAQVQFSKIRTKVEKILTNPLHNDPVFNLVNRIFNHKSPLNLCRPDPQRFEIRNLARKRFVLGYPPRKNNDTSIGDAINWEWLIRCAKNSTENHSVMIVSRDGDFGVSYGNDMFLNDWLRREFKDRVSRKRNIQLTNRLTDALRKLDEMVAPEDEQEERKIIRDDSNDLFGSLEKQPLRVPRGMSREAFEKLYRELIGEPPSDRNPITPFD
ncbi:PIN domain-containing protein [Mesorhizobium sp. IMUNJ 23033]|uniref:PIN domain-containing protein n=1 Tax=Mesorhizobium sp. IMUNJ 23033 TaxID=3378039 RepID=UPI00384B7D9D